jgi:gliding motility-associated-like protein
LRLIKKIVPFLIIFCSLFAKAQLDLEHWFPPIYKTVGGVPNLYLYFSTDKTTPFQIKIFGSKDDLIATLILSKSAPIVYKISSVVVKYLIIPETSTMSVQNFGIHISGENSFYSSLRIIASNHDYNAITETVSSKGKTAFGKEFFTVMDENIVRTNVSYPYNYEASIMAIQDGTHIKVTNIDKRLIFCDDNKHSEIDITLNKGQTYTVAALKSANNDPNNILDDNDPNLIGAKVVSDKEIVMINGNCNSSDQSHLHQPPPNSDISAQFGNVNFDQSVPTSKIGKEYFIINGLTNITNMEKAIIVATKNNTKIFLNGSKTPLVTLNEGEHFLGPYNDSNFQSNSALSFTNAEGVIIKTLYSYFTSSEPVYLYQLIGGFQHQRYRGEDLYPSFTEETSGMTFSFPVDKTYATNLLQIPASEKMGDESYDTKLIIKAESNANISINNSSIGSGDPILQKPGWSYHTLLNVSGDLNITSDKQFSVDLYGGKPYTGYASSYTSVSNDPTIIKNGNCIQEGILLSLTNIDFEGFQWQLNGVDIPGAINSTYIPLLPGDYTCKCFYSGFSYSPSSVNVIDCPYNVTTTNLGNLCPNFTIFPKFSPPNTNLTVSKIEITSQPFHGTAVLTNNQIIVTNDAAYSGYDRLVYKITATNGFYETVKVEFILFPLPIADIASEIMPTAVISNTYFYDLNTIIANQNGEDFHFFETRSDAENNANEILILKDYISTSDQVFVKITSSNGCTIIKSVLLLKPSTADVLLPNAITPNGDGINDVWDYSLLNKVHDLNIKIFDRYGKVVFARPTNSQSFTWDGKDKNGNKLPTNTYWVFVTFRIDQNGALINKTQWLLIKNR